MNAYLFNPLFSNHSPRVFSSIIISELRRFTFCCTNVWELQRVRGLYATRLAARGYPSELISECFKSAINSVMFPFDPPRVNSKKRR